MSTERAVQALSVALANGECCLECQYAASNRCDCPCDGQYHGMATVLTLDESRWLRDNNRNLKRKE